ncbi:MAG: hypothetical protein GY870_08775 [archaeon]|nr:hypothetical protein [archaeon]
MNFDENEILSAALIGFDMIEGPFMKWTQEFVENKIKIDFQSFMMNFYLSFRGGNDGMKPRAILYDDFYIVAFPHGLELCCLFMKPRGVGKKLDNLGKIAESIITQVEEEDNIFGDGEGGQDHDEIKRIITNMLRGNELSTPEIRKHFKMSNSEVWKVMSELEESQNIVRTQKVGRSQLWTCVH